MKNIYLQFSIIFYVSFLILGIARADVFGDVTSITLSETLSVPALSDETATYSFTSSAEGTIVYGGRCGSANISSAVVGENQVTWRLANGVYSDCTITVKNLTTSSNTLSIPEFESTSKYPVVFVHGLYGSSKAWSSTKSYLIGQGWKSELLIANSITESNTTMCGTASPKQAQEVAGWIDAVLKKYPGFEKVDLVGHSRGGNNIMRGLWHGYINHSDVRRVVTMSGANRDCAPYYPAIPSDETPGTISFSVYYSDGTPDIDTAVDYRNTNVSGAYHENLYPLSHSEMKDSAVALTAMQKSLVGEVGAPVTVDSTRPTVTGFTVPAEATSITVPITTFTATDDVWVTGYCVQETNSETGCIWSTTPPSSYTFTSEGIKNIYGFAKDEANNISLSKSGSVTITLPIVYPTCTNFTYSEWSACDNNSQSRTVTTSNPASCVEGTPVLTQSCWGKTPTYTLGVAMTGTGSGTVTGAGISCGVDCMESLPQGSTVTLTATPATGSIFNGWFGACSGTEATCTVSLSSIKVAMAIFTSVPVIADTNASTPVNFSLPSYTFSKSLQLGVFDPDVKALQQLLNVSGYTIVLSGAGSVGYETSYFGPATKSAVTRFQQANNIGDASSYGLVGPITRAKLNELQRNISGE